MATWSGPQEGGGDCQGQGPRVTEACAAGTDRDKPQSQGPADSKPLSGTPPAGTVGVSRTLCVPTAGCGALGATGTL